MSEVSVRYIVEDVAATTAFYATHLGFEVEQDAAPDFAALRRGSLRLLVNSATGAGGASQPMPDGRRPAPGGWNRVQLQVADLATLVSELRTAGASFRNDVVSGRGGQQILLEDPSGNLVELFQPPS
jgi:catechol 2,3-dioxygenase-like lactoylglutathione lyase family enzyme